MSEIVWHGAAALEDSLRALGDLQPHPKNPKRGAVDEIANSLARFGQVRAVLIDADDTIIAGNHTFLAARDLGWSHIAVTVNRFDSPEEARAYLLADNKLGDLGEYEHAELRILLEELEAKDRWEGTGYKPDDLGHLRQLGEIQDAPLPPAPPAPPPVTQLPELREVVLLLTDEQASTFAESVRTLRPRYELEGVTETVLEAVRREALRLNQSQEAA